MADGRENQRIAIERPDVRLAGGRAMKPILPRAQPRLPLLRRRVSFVGEIIGDARERIDRRHVRAHRRRQQPRRHRKIFVMRPRQLRAGGVAARHGLRSIGHGQILPCAI